MHNLIVIVFANFNQIKNSTFKGKGRKRGILTFSILVINFFKRFNFSDSYNSQKKTFEACGQTQEKNFLSHTMLKARYSDDAEPEYSSNNIHLSLALQKFETSLAAKLRSLSRKKEPSRSQRFISSRLLIDHFVFLLIGISHQSIKGTNNAYGHEDQSILFFSSKGDGENNSWQEAPCSLHKKEGG